MPFTAKAELGCRNLSETQVPPPLAVTEKLFGPVSITVPSKGKFKTSAELKGVIRWALADKPYKKNKQLVIIPNNDLAAFFDISISS